MTGINENDFLDVLIALSDNKKNTGEDNILVSGWDIEDEQIKRPYFLEHSLSELNHHYEKYCYISECYKVKEFASEVFSRCVTYNDLRLEKNNTAVLPSGSVGLHLSLIALRDHGVRKIFASTPNFFATYQICQHLGLDLKFIPTKGFLECKLDYERISDSLKEPCSAFIMSNPAYSVGIEYSPSDLKKLFCLVPKNNFIIFDEVFLGLNWNTQIPWKSYDIPDNVIVLRSPSKIFMMYGLKTCFVISSPKIINYIEVLSDFLTTGIPGNFEGIANSYLNTINSWYEELDRSENGQVMCWKQSVINRLRHNLDEISSILEGFNFDLAQIESGPYVSAAIDKQILYDDFNTINIARKTGVLLMMSEYYYHKSRTHQGFRINLCGNIQSFVDALLRILPMYLKD